MRRWAALLFLLGCGSDAEVVDLPADPEAAAVEFLTHHVFDEPATLADRFTREARPEEFPLRLMIPEPDQLRFVDVWRAQMVDGRLVLSALVEIGGEPNIFELWLEEQEGRWRIGGWSPLPRAVDPGEPAEPAGVRIPAPFAPATFRGAVRSPVVPLDAPAVIEAVPEAEAVVEARLRRVRFSGTCARATLQRTLRSLTPRLARCHPPEAAPRGGRLTFRLTLEANKATVELTETTLLDSALTDCLRGILETIRVRLGAGEACEAVVPITLVPRRE